MSVGLAVGKFYPPHEGHHKLIDTMLEECERAIVAVCHSSVESIAITDRIAWLKDRHPKAVFMPVKDDSPVLYTDETWGLFLNALMDALETVLWWGTRGLSDRFDKWPDVVYSGEDYVPEFARRLTERYRDKHDGYRHFMPTAVSFRKLERGDMPGVSATAFRANPPAHWDLLAPATRAGLCKRIVVCGAESTGTTTLAKQLGEHYKTTVVPEYGRHFDWAVGRHHEWTTEDFRHIVREQRRWENHLARYSEGGLLICDTDGYATAMFHHVYMGEDAPLDIYDIACGESRAALYIITDDQGIDFEDDGTRHDSGCRPWQTEWFVQNLPEEHRMVVTGSRQARLDAATNAIDSLLKSWPIEAPIEYRRGYEHRGLVQR